MERTKENLEFCEKQIERLIEHCRRTGRPLPSPAEFRADCERTRAEWNEIEYLLLTKADGDSELEQDPVKKVIGRLISCFAITKQSKLLLDTLRVAGAINGIAPYPSELAKTVPSGGVS